MKNHYKTLGLPVNASKAEITSSFRQLAKKWHPDVSMMPNATEVFCNIYEAYEILSDTKKKETYDISISQPSYTHQNSASTTQAQPHSSNHSRNDTQSTYHVWEQEAQAKAKFYSGVKFSVFTKRVKYAFTPEVRLTGWFENTILPHLFLVAFFPLGLYMVWNSKTLPRWYQRGIFAATAVIVLAYLSLILMNK